MLCYLLDTPVLCRAVTIYESGGGGQSSGRAPLHLMRSGVRAAGGGGGGRSDWENATTALSGMPPLHQAQLAAFSFAEHPQREGAAATNPTGGGSGATASKRSSGPPLPLVPTGGKVQQKPVNGGKEKEGDGQQVAEQVRSHIH